MRIAERDNARDYSSFNDFFSRALVADARAIDGDTSSIVSPVDGAISQLGKIEGDRIFQAKGKDFRLATLLADNDSTLADFTNGGFTTIYLSPRDYHRIHMPFEGRLLKMTFVPGQLFSVNKATTNSVDQLFARNERVVCLFETSLGKVAIVLVGALFVGSMETVWHGEIVPQEAGKVCNWDYSEVSDTQLDFNKGDEIGRFNMGSTVILLFEAERAHWSESLQAGTKVVMGEKIATATH